MPYKILQGDCRDTLAQIADKKVQTCITSPPYFGLRDYGMADQIGLEQTPKQFVDELVAVFREVKRTLKDDGTLWLNIGDSYANDNKWGGSTSGKHVKALHGDTSVGREKRSTGLAPKNLIGIPWRLAFALQDDGWYLRQDIIWHKPNPMPESVTDRCTKAHEYIFLLSKSPKYYFDHEAIKEASSSTKPAGNKTHKYADEYAKGESELHRTKAGRVALAGVEWDTRNKRSVWTVATKPYAEAHFATFPPELIRPCVLAGSRPGDIVLDPFSGSGTTGQVAMEEQRVYLGCELNPDYIALTHRRLRAVQPNLQFV